MQEHVRKQYFKSNRRGAHVTCGHNYSRILMLQVLGPQESGELPKYITK